jgi:uncharacterized protein YjbJ (UPF0337 family)
MAGAQQSITEQLTGAALPAAEKTGQESGSKFSSSLVKGIGAGSVAVAGAVAGVSGALIKTAGDTAAYGDQIDKASQKLGVSSTFYQEWQAVLQHSGTDMDKMSATFKKLATASQDASADQQAAFEKLGLSMDDVSKMSPEELFTHVISGLQGMEEGTERTSLATTLLGKGAMEMGALLNTSSEDTQAMIDKVHDLGGVMGEDAVKASARYQDSLQDMQTAFDGIKNGVGAKLLPVLADFMDKVADFITNTDLTPLTDMVGKAVEGLGNFISNLDIEAIGNTFQTVVTTIGEVLGTAWDAMSIIFEALQGAFQTITDSLNTTGTDWSDVWNGISEVITTVATVIGEIIGIIASVIAGLITEAQTEGTLFNAVWESIQIAIQAAGDIIKGVIDFVSALLSGDWKGAWDAAEGVVETMTNAIDNVVTTIFNGIADFLLSVWDTIKNTVSNAVTAVKDKISNVFSAARDTVHNIFEDIKNGVRQKFVDMVRDVLGKVIAIKDGIKERFQQAKDTALRIFDDIKNGIKDKIEWAKDKVSGIVDTIKNLFDFDWSLPDLKLPHISISEYLDVPGLGTVPAPWGIHVDWYAKAYDSPYLFTSPTVMNGRGFGDRGNRYGGELVYSHDKLMDDIRRASGGGTFAPTINVYTQENQSNEEIAQYVMDKLTREYQRAARYV